MDTRDNGEEDVLLDALLGVVAARNDAGGASLAETALALQCVRLLKERDGARREVCHLIGEGAADPRDVALTRGWRYLDDRPEPSCDWKAAAG